MSLPVAGACFGEIFLRLQSWKYFKPETVLSLCALWSVHHLQWLQLVINMPRKHCSTLRKTVRPDHLFLEVDSGSLTLNRLWEGSSRRGGEGGRGGLRVGESYKDSGVTSCQV